MSKNLKYGHRGSSSDHAKAYKKKGHSDEDDFALIIGGSVEKGTQKEDVVGPDGTRYTCKGGGKHWQILLYSLSNFKINQWGELGTLFEYCLNCFPTDYSIYEKDKLKAKEIIYTYLREQSETEIYDHKSAMKLDSKIKKELKKKLRNNITYLKELMGENNSYLNSKIKLQEVTAKMKIKFDEGNQIRFFLEKGIFNNNDVDMLAVREHENFLIFDKNDVLDIFENNLKSINSKAGYGIDDINIDGQKTILKYRTNICELEIRNDSKIHYRQVRFNMKREKALNLLKKNCIKKPQTISKVNNFEKI